MLSGLSFYFSFEIKKSIQDILCPKKDMMITILSMKMMVLLIALGTIIEEALIDCLELLSLDTTSKLFDSALVSFSLSKT